ncbi:nicotinate-nucleotide--dimethylbenzimidazole phosphoribosyltransferase [Streptomyces sp. A012304]|uniref:nicotinate-nucleotide--dimethylbenzimidazole phosphoribosyltransferase n=1 Tax=Streptomyces sp. A012304 TaxID=375446 RepID=UPI00223143F6|nr:nicotinate-nucleotide--dimethylbenzimidazole phosphoribosyltransferase [Streptomyces sp. A012304]GKQ40398.1 hypothetical protein ALMP_69240 [Streptomyces sp. A012304]
MTDTGQVPGEGLPENAGMVEQPGVPAPGAYTYLSETTAEDEDLLLLPGAQSAWGNEVAPPAPEPVVEAVHEPGPHETAGRDSGAVDLSAVRLPNPTPPPAASRRPLHLGPPIPDTSASPVRSLADRGPAGAPVRHPGPPTSGPEYLDVPPLRETAPQGAVPWGAQAAAAVQAPVAPGATAAETVVPAAAPGVAPASAPTAAPAVAPAAAPVTAAPTAAPASAPAPAPAAAPDTAAVAQQPEPVSAAQAVVARVATEAIAATAVPQAEGQTQSSEQPEQSQEPEQPEQGAETPQVVAEAPQVAEPAPVPAPAPEPVPAPEQVAGPPASELPASEPPASEPPAAPVAAEGEVPAAPAQETAEAGAVAAPEVVAEAAAEPAPEPVQAPEEPAAEAPAAQAPSADVPVAEVPAPEAAQAPETAVPAEAVPAEAVPEPAAEAVDAVEPAPEATQAPESETEAAPEAEAPAPEAEAPAPEASAEAAPEPVAVPAQAETAVPEAEAPVPAPEAAAPEVPVEAAVPVSPEPAELPDAPQAPAVQAAEAEHAPDELTSDEQAPVRSAPDAQPSTPSQPEQQQPDPVHIAAHESHTPDATATVAAEAVPAPEAAAHEAPAPEATPAPHPQPDQPLGQFVPVEGTVPTTPHLAPTPPQPVVVATEEPQAPEPAAEPAAAAAEAPVAAVPAPREADTAPAPAAEAAPETEPATGTPEPDPDVAQNPEDLDTRAADQEDATAAAEEPREPSGPAAPPYDDAEREAVLKVMRERRDIRNGFRDDPIPHEVLLRVLEAAHTAPSVGHSQPWDFVVIRSADTRRAMHELATRQRDAYAKSLPKGRAKQFKELKIEAILDTPVNIVVTADPTRGGRHTLGRHTQPQMAPYSSALAVENLWLAARAEGLGVGWVSFFDEREMVRALGLPEHLEVVAYLCVGYVDEFPDEPELMQAGWAKRRPLSWVVHEETYGRRALPGEDPHDLLAETVAGIRPLDAKALGEAWERQKRMTKPAGALGMLEIISAQLSGLSRQCPPPIPEPAAVAIFAGDHGVHAQGVTPWPQEVTAQMVANFLGGGAVCNAFATQVGAEVCVVDVGVAADLPATPGLLPRKIRGGTSDMTTGPAMTREEAKQAIEVGIETARDLVAAGNKALLTGEMGIANTTASAALISVFTGADPAEVTGRGTGINDETLARKTEVVRRALELHQPDPADPIGVLAALGGFEHAAMVGLLLGGASLRTPVILDGVSAGAAALVARAIAPEVLAACIAGHRSAEPGHVAALNKLGLRPLVDLDLRLGEGTGALLALPLVQSTARAMHEVATFDSAGVTEK